MQYRNEYKLVSLPKLGASIICPYRALHNIMDLYNPNHQSPLFQVRTTEGLQVLADWRIRKV